MTLSAIKERFFSENALVKNSAILFAGTMFANVLNYVFHLVVGRIVSVEIYGEAESLISLMNIIAVPAATIAMVAAKYAANCKAESDKLGSRAIWKYLNQKIVKYGLPLFIITALITPYVGKFLNIQNNFTLIIIWLSMLLSFFHAVNSGMLQGWQRFKQISLMGIWGVVVKLIFGIVLVKIGFGLNGIIGSFTLGALASYLASTLALKFILLKKEDNAQSQCETTIDFQSLRHYILPVFIGSLAITILGNADMVLAKHILSPLDAGQYGALTIVSKIIFFGTGVIASVLFSLSAENHHKNIDTFAIFRKASLFMLIVSALGVIFYFLFPGFILGLLFGSKYASAASYLGWFAVMVSLFSFLNLIFQYLLSIKKTKIAYGLLLVALVSVFSVLFIAKDIYDILVIMILSQIIGVAVGLFFLWTKDRKSSENYFVDIYNLLRFNN